MGQAESKRPNVPTIQVQSPQKHYLSAHHPEKPGTPTRDVLNVPENGGVRRKSIDTAEISKSFEEEKHDSLASRLSTPDKKVKVFARSPIFGKKRQQGTRASADFNLPIVVPGWLDSLQIPNPISGRRSRRQSAEQAPISIKAISSKSDSWSDDGPKIPANEIFNPPKDMIDDDEDDPAPKFRNRASTIGNGQIPKLARAPSEQDVLQSSDKSIKVPVVLRFTNTLPKVPSNVYVAGSMTDWKSVEMAVCKGDKEFNLILDCPPGKYYYKFFVNNEWCVDESQPVSSYMTRKPSSGKSGKLAKANVITVKQEDLEVFEALACDSFAIRNVDKFSDKNWGQHKPKFESTSQSGQSGASSGPPILPPQLLNILLNKEKSDRNDPVLLPEPSSHVMLNHLYAQSIRDNMLVMASTTRYRKKCVTIVYYMPLED